MSDIQLHMTSTVEVPRPKLPSGKWYALCRCGWVSLATSPTVATQEEARVIGDAHLREANGPAPTLPVNEDGDVITSANFGEAYIVQIEWGTDFDGRVIDPDTEDYAVTFHGPFVDLDEARQWMDAYPDDTDVHDMTTVVLNKVRP